MKIYEIPLYTYVGKKKISLSLNWYERAHFGQIHSVKKWMRKLVETLSMINGYSSIGNITKIEYGVYFGSKKRRDLRNCTSVIDKLFCDALVSCNLIKDDNFNYISEVRDVFLGISDNPVCIVKIFEGGIDDE